MCERVRHHQCRRLYVLCPVLSGLYRLLGAILRSKTKVMAQFCSQHSERGRGRKSRQSGAGEGACNKWDICQLLLLLPLLLLSMLLAAIKTRKNVYFAKAPSFFCLFLSSSFYPSPLFRSPLLVVVRLFAFWLGLLPPVQVVLCVNRHKYMCT